MTEDRRVIQLNYRTSTKVATEGARAYLVLSNRGNAHDRIAVLVRSRGGRWVQKWEAMSRLTNFRVKTLPPEHPLYGNWHIWSYGNPEHEHYLDELAAELNAAAAREAR